MKPAPNVDLNLVTAFLAGVAFCVIVDDVAIGVRLAMAAFGG